VKGVNLGINASAFNGQRTKSVPVQHAAEPLHSLPTTRGVQLTNQCHGQSVKGKQYALHSNSRPTELVSDESRETPIVLARLEASGESA